MKRSLSMTLLIISLLLINSLTQVCAQTLIKDIPLKVQVDNSSLIIEGKVIAKKSFWDDDRGLIYTANTIEVYKVFKGKSTQTIDVITLGGVVGLKALIVNPSLKLNKGDLGVFMLQKSEISSSASQSKSNQKTYSSSKGFYKYNMRNNLVVNANTFKIKKGIKDLFYKEIMNLTRGNIVEKLNFDVNSRLKKESVNKGSLAPSITDLDKLTVTAGTKEALTIIGTGFGDAKGKVWFSNSNDGGVTFIKALDSQIITWDDMEITVEVPSEAGTGPIYVEHDDTSESPLFMGLTVSYAEINIVGDFGQGELAYQIQHVATNNDGGYTFEMFTDFFNDTEHSGAKTAFESAFNNWVCETGINWTISNSASNIDAVGVDTMDDGNMDGQPDEGDGTNIIRFDNGDELETITMNEDILGACFSWYSGCGSNPAVWYVKELDLVFDDDTSWNFGPEPTTSPGRKVDFESIVLHELGHGHQLGHVNDTGNSMNFNLSTNEDQRFIESTNSLGANIIQDRGVESSVCRFPSLTDALCPLSISDEEQDNVISIYPNPSNGVFYIKNKSSIGIEKLSIYDVSGRLILEQDISNDSNITINLRGVSKGMYLISLLSNNGIISSKMLID